MNQTLLDPEKNRAYLIYSEWGPNRQIPRDERLADLFLNIGPQIRTAWIEDFKAIDSAIWRFAESGGPRLNHFDQFKRTMLESFPFMDRQALERAWTLCGYYTVVDGY